MSKYQWTLFKKWQNDQTTNNTSLQPPPSPLSPLSPPSVLLPHLASSPFDFLHGRLLFLLLQAQPSARIDRSPSSSASPPLYLTMATNSPVLTLLHPRLRGSEEKSITVPSGAGSGVNEVLDKCVRGRKEWERGKSAGVCVLCEYMSVCCIRSGQEKQSDQRPRGCKCQACQGSNLWPLIGAACVCVRRWWMCVFVWIMVESDRGEESSYKAHYGQTSQWNKWIPGDVIVKTLPFMDPSIHPFVYLFILNFNNTRAQYKKIYENTGN